VHALLRILTRPPILGGLVLAGVAAGSLAVGRSWATRPTASPAPQLGLPAAVQTPRTSSTETSFEPVVPAPPAPAALVLRLRDDRDWGIRVFAADALLPAVSEDGKTIIELFEDGEDFTGAPITTLVGWSRSGSRKVAFALGGAAGTRAPSAERVLRAANAWLAKARWRHLDGAATIGRSDDGERSTITTRTGATLQFDASTGRFTRVERTRRRALRASFGAPGSAMEARGGCGEILGVERAFGNDHLVVVVPTVNLGGDSCFGLPSSDLAIALTLD
jgi:hypothetical protein